MKLSKKKAAVGILFLFILIQIFSIDKTNPKVDSNLNLYDVVEIPDDVQNLLKASCNDCHSNETKYPWYTNIEPVSWWIKGHINGGREHLNFSEWESYNPSRKSHKITECIEVVEKKWMPISSYTWLHPNSKLDEEQRKRLIIFFESLRG